MVELKSVVDELDIVARPECLADGQGVIELAASLGERQPCSEVLVPLPADTDTEVESATGQHVDRGCRLRQHNWAPKRSEQDVGGEAHPFGHGGEVSDDGQRFEPVTIRTGRLSPTGDPTLTRVSIGVEVRPERDMIRQGEPIDAGLIGKSSPFSQVLPPARIGGTEGDEGQRELWGHARAWRPGRSRRKTSAQERRRPPRRRRPSPVSAGRSPARTQRRAPEWCRRAPHACRPSGLVRCHNSPDDGTPAVRTRWA